MSCRDGGGDCDGSCSFHCQPLRFSLSPHRQVLLLPLLISVVVDRQGDLCFWFWQRGVSLQEAVLDGCRGAQGRRGIFSRGTDGEEEGSGDRWCGGGGPILGAGSGDGVLSSCERKRRHRPGGASCDAAEAKQAASLRFFVCHLNLLHYRVLFIDSNQAFAIAPKEKKQQQN